MYIQKIVNSVILHQVMRKGNGFSLKVLEISKGENMSLSSCMFDKYPKLSPSIGGAEQTFPGYQKQCIDTVSPPQVPYCEAKQGKKLWYI